MTHSYDVAMFQAALEKKTHLLPRGGQATATKSQPKIKAAMDSEVTLVDVTSNSQPQKEQSSGTHKLPTSIPHTLGLRKAQCRNPLGQRSERGRNHQELGHRLRQCYIHRSLQAINSLGIGFGQPIGLASFVIDIKTEYDIYSVILLM